MLDPDLVSVRSESIDSRRLELDPDFLDSRIQIQFFLMFGSWIGFSLWSDLDPVNLNQDPKLWLNYYALTEGTLFSPEEGKNVLLPLLLRHDLLDGPGDLPGVVQLG